METQEKLNVSDMPIGWLIGKPMEKIEEILAVECLNRCRGNRAAAAKMLGVGERTLYRILSRVKACK
jgi:DNA-binding NtrC family response regulator